MKNSARITQIVVTILLAATSAAASAQSKRISGETWFGCTSKDYHSKLTSMAVQGDKQAFSKGLMAGMVSGQCVVFKSGEAVYLEDTALFSGMVQVRRAGSVGSYWTNMEAVK